MVDGTGEKGGGRAMPELAAAALLFVFTAEATVDQGVSNGEERRETTA